MSVPDPTAAQADVSRSRPPAGPDGGPGVVHRGRKFSVEVVELPGERGGTIQREVVRHPGAVVILPVLDPQKGAGGGRQIVLIENERFAVGRKLLELPAGTLDDGEPPAQCAARELIEEAGYEAATLTPFGRFYSSPGFTDELMHAFLARQLRHVGQRLEEDEQVTVRPTPIDEAIAMACTGGIMDGKTIACLLLARQKGLI